MNNVFSFKRFRKLMLYDGDYFLKKAGWAVVGIPLTSYGVYALATLAIYPDLDYSPSQRFSAVMFVVYLTVFWVIEKLYGGEKGSTRNADYAILPASNFEKMISMFLFCAVIPSFAVFVLSVLFDSLLVWIPGSFEQYLWNADDWWKGMSDVEIKINQYFAQYRTWWRTCLGVFFWASLLIFGTLLFKENGTKKTLLVLPVMFFGFILLENLLDGVGNIDMIQYSDNKSICSSMVTNRRLALCFSYLNDFVLLPILLVLSYKRLKSLKY